MFPSVSLTPEDVITAEVLALALLLFFICLLALALVFAVVVRLITRPPQPTASQYRRFTHGNLGILV